MISKVPLKVSSDTCYPGWLWQSCSDLVEAAGQEIQVADLTSLALVLVSQFLLAVNSQLRLATLPNFTWLLPKPNSACKTKLRFMSWAHSNLRCKSTLAHLHLRAAGREFKTDKRNRQSTRKALNALGVRVQGPPNP